MKKLFLILFFISTTLFFFKVKESNRFRDTIIQKNKIIDSLNQEIFVKDIELSRDQYTLEKLKEVDSLCAMMYEAVREMETE
jgi:hypothetical protein